MALAGRRDAPEPPDFGILKRLARDQLVYLLEQVRGLPGAGILHGGGRRESVGSVSALELGVGSRGRPGRGPARSSRWVPAHALLLAAPREEGPVHRGRPDEPPGPHRQRVHPEGTAGSGRAAPAALPAATARAEPAPCPRSSTTWTSCTRWRPGRPPAPATSECPGAEAARSRACLSQLRTCLRGTCWCPSRALERRVRGRQGRVRGAPLSRL